MISNVTLPQVLQLVSSAMFMNIIIQWITIPDFQWYPRTIMISKTILSLSTLACYEFHVYEHKISSRIFTSVNNYYSTIKLLMLFLLTHYMYYCLWIDATVDTILTRYM